MRKSYLYINNLLKSKEILQVAISFFLVVWVIFIATPFDIIASNSEEFTLTPGSSILWNGFYYSVLALSSLVVSYAAIPLVFKSHIRRLVFFIVITLSLSVWLNSTFLTGIYGEFDGRGNLQIEPFSPLTWTQIGAFFGILVFVLYFRNRPRILTYTLAAICFISLLTGVVNISLKLSERTIIHADEDNFFTYSKTNPNLLIILLDEYQSDYFSEILDDEVKNDLDGFVWFKDAAANFPTTIAALPAMFSGEIYKNDVDIKDFYNDVSAKSIANKLSDQGFRVSYTKSSPMSETLFPDKSLVKFNSLDPQYLSAYSDLINYSIFRAVPDLLKPNVHNDGKWLIRLRNTTQYDALRGIGLSFKNLKYLADREPIITNGPPTFKFHHSVVTHSPTVLGAACEAIGKVPSTLQNKSAEGKCAMSKVVQIISNLKNADVFDNTMIIITADHGSVYKPKSFNKNMPYSKASPILLIKPLDSNNPFQTSNAPAQLSDIPSTVAAAFDIPNISYPGINLLSDNIPKNITRIFNNYIWSSEYHDWSKSRVPPITKYQITGPLYDPNNWRSLKRLVSLDCDATLVFSHAESSQYYLDNLSARETWGRWSDGDLAEIEFQSKQDCQAKSITFNLGAFITTKNPEQTASVFINDKPTGHIRISLGDSRPKQFTFALPDTKDNSYTIRFEIDKPTTPESVGVNRDTRELGLGFVSMKLSQDEVAAQ